MIQRDDEGHRWLRCDCCADVDSPPYEPRDFYGIGLTTARQVRQCAHDLFGWRRRRVLTSLDPVTSRWVDMCVGCQSPEHASVRLFATLLRIGE